MTMPDEMPDSLFKLRLTGPLRQRLEAEAARRGLTLTGEILRRIDESFSDVSERLAALEKVVFDGNVGNEILSHEQSLHSSAIEELQYSVGNMWRAIK